MVVEGSKLGGFLIRLLLVVTTGLWAVAEITRLVTGNEPRIGQAVVSGGLFLATALWLFSALSRSK